ncbi:unnamed protein product, partial [Closterium sp. NIES-54]
SCTETVCAAEVAAHDCYDAFPMLSPIPTATTTTTAILALSGVIATISSGTHATAPALVLSQFLLQLPLHPYPPPLPLPRSTSSSPLPPPTSPLFPPTSYLAPPTLHLPPRTSHLPHPTRHQTRPLSPAHEPHHPHHYSPITVHNLPYLPIIPFSFIIPFPTFPLILPILPILTVPSISPIIPISPIPPIPISPIPRVFPSLQVDFEHEDGPIRPLGARLPHHILHCRPRVALLVDHCRHVVTVAHAVIDVPWWGGDGFDRGVQFPSCGNRPGFLLHRLRLEEWQSVDGSTPGSPLPVFPEHLYQL